MRDALIRAQALSVRFCTDGPSAPWCATAGQNPLAGNPGLIALYLTKRAEDGLAVPSLNVARAAIRAAHRLAGVPLDLADPRLSLVMEGISRSKAARTAPPSRRRRARPAAPAAGRPAPPRPPPLRRCPPATAPCC